jgi:hypothetical protein
VSRREPGRFLRAPRVVALWHSIRCRERSRGQIPGMTKTQCRELKTVLLMIASRLSSEVLDDEMRILLYRAQTLADASHTSRPSVREAMSKAG